MKEIEVKARCDNLAAIKEKLVVLGCTFSPVLSQEDSIYLPVPFEFGDIRPGTPVVRIRNSNGVLTLNLKKSLSERLAKREYEVIINDFAACDEIVRNMDFHEVLHISKKREKCRYQNMEICLDEVKNLGSFLEVEQLISEDEDHIPVQQSLWDFLKRFNIAENDRVYHGYDELLYQKNLKEYSQFPQ